ncbi:MAG: hypothetical protein ACRCU2_24990 [Planktothrix sp.]
MTKINNYFDYLYFTECDILSFKWELEIKPRFDSQSVSYHEVSNLLVHVKNLGILQDHPLNPPSHESSIIFWPKRCTCIFKEVKTSILQMNRYCEDPPGSKQFVPGSSQEKIENVFSVDEPLNEFSTKDRVSVDEPLNEFSTKDGVSVDEPLNEFFIEGMYQDPVAWIDWEIKSRSFALEIKPKDKNRVLTGLEYSKLHAGVKTVEVG